MHLLEVLSRLKKVGLSTEEKEIIQITDEPKFYSFLSFPDEKAEKKYRTVNAFGQGYDSNKTLAKIKSVGEYLERLSIDNLDQNSLIESKFSEGKNFIAPELFCSYSNDQVNLENFIGEIRKSSFKWYPAQELTTGKKVYIPGQMIFLSPIFDDEFQIRGERITTGTALGLEDSVRATESGFLESVERDSCMGAYLQKKDIPKIINPPDKIKTLINYFERYFLETNVFDVTTNLGIPSVLAITLDRTGIGSAVNVGSKSSFNPLEAMGGAIMESVQCRRLSRISKEPEINEEEVNSLSNRFFYWNKLERINDLSFWFDSKNTTDYNSFKLNKTSLKKSLNLFREKNFHVFLADITLPEIKEQGIEVLKTIVPELHPMYLNEESKMFYSKHYGEIKDLHLKPHPMT